MKKKKNYVSNACAENFITIKKVLPLICFLFIISNSFAQKEGNFWFFGNNAGLDFNSGAPVALTVGALNTSEGCAAISNSAGELLFYTDGLTVFNKLHEEMPNGFGLLGGVSSTQSAIIVPKPGSSTIYYIFTTPNAGGGDAGLNFSEVDMTLEGGLGDVTATKNVLLFSPVNEKLTAVKKSNNVDVWVISHNDSTNEFLAFSVTAAGVSITPVISAAGTTETETIHGMGYLRASPDGTKLASVVAWISVVDMLNFNTTTGTITYDFTFTPPFTFQQAYGAEFSPDGSRLYISSSASANIYQYNMLSASATTFIASATLIGTSATSQMGALQTGPDGKIYIAKWTQPTISCINNPNALGTACNYMDDAVNLAGEFSTGGLPNFITSYFSGSPFNYVNKCVGDSTFFTLANSIAVDSIHWNFGDPSAGINNASTALSAQHLFSAVGDYTVSVTTYQGSVVSTSGSIVHILGTPVISLGNDTAMCAGGSVILDAGFGAYSFLWQDGSTAETFTTAEGGTYFVSVNNGCGTSSDTIHVSTNLVVAVNDVSICKGQTATLTASGGASVYTWSDSLGSGPSITVSPTVTTNYSVTGISGACPSSSDTATVSVNSLPAPSFTASVTSGNAPLCVQFNETGGNSCAHELYLFGNGDSSTTSSPNYCFTVPNTYAVALICTDTNGCVGIAKVTELVQASNISIPNVFTPNGDNKNDKFYIENLQSGTVKLTVFDRWGDLVYSSLAYNNDWDGNGASDGVYYYVLNNTMNGETYTGFVQILQNL